MSLTTKRALAVLKELRDGGDVEGAGKQMSERDLSGAACEELVKLGLAYRLDRKGEPALYGITGAGQRFLQEKGQ